MKVCGQLERAQLELLSTPPSAPNLPGRMWADITNPAAALPMFQDGTTNRRLAYYEATPGMVTQNSGLAVTVDWSTGLVQKVILTAPAVISFSNPQADKVHTLIVQQGATIPADTFAYVLDMPDQETRGLPFQPNGVLSSTRNEVHQWYYKSGIRPALISMPFAQFQPPTLPATLATGIDISPSGDSVAMGRTSTPFTSYYTLFPYIVGMNNPFTPIQPTPVANASQVTGIAFSKDGRALYYAQNTSPYIQGFFLDRGSNFGTAFANPGALPAGGGRSLAVHPSGLFVGIGHATTPFMSIYPTPGGAFGTRVTDPLTLPAAQINGIAWSATGDFLAVASQTTPFLQVYPWSNANGAGAFGAIIANPISLPTGGPPPALGKGVAWRPQGDFIAMVMTTSPYLYVVPFDRATSSFGTPLTVSGLAAPANQLNGVTWSPCGQFLVCVGNASDSLIVYDFTNKNLNTRIPLFAGTATNDVVFHPSGDYFLYALNASPFAQGYWAPWVQKNYLKLLE